jgi:hypothetical protein
VVAGVVGRGSRGATFATRADVRAVTGAAVAYKNSSYSDHYYDKHHLSGTGGDALGRNLRFYNRTFGRSGRGDAFANGAAVGA